MPSRLHKVTCTYKLTLKAKYTGSKKTLRFNDDHMILKFHLFLPYSQ